VPGPENFKHLLTSGVFRHARYMQLAGAVGAELGVDYDFGVRLPAAAQGVATEDELKRLLEEIREAAENKSVLIAQACLPGWSQSSRCQGQSLSCFT
jgi:hypothetical protein